MPLSWNEIKSRAISFSKEWENETSEDAEAKSFWDGFFHVFGISRRRVAAFETKVRKQGGNQGFIDMLWKGVILVEHKSKGKSLEKAYSQAKDYFPGLKEHELPRYILVCDFERFQLYDLEAGSSVEFPLSELLKNVQHFGFIAGYQQRTFKEEDPANIEAAERMGKLHDALEASGYSGHALEVYLVRLLFCLFAEDTSIFERTQFQDYIDKHTKEDGSDLAMHLAQFFQILNTPEEKRLNTLDESLKAFPYVNGKLFEEMLPFAAFSSQMRDMLLYAAGLDWSKISPAIFGSMFQSVMNPKERRNLGAHYTSEKNILKLVKPLFLDKLQQDFQKAKGNKNKLTDLQTRLGKLHFLDPACGCGNFLIISYRELRLLELDILRELNKSGQGFIDVRDLLKVDVDQFTGIEYDEFPARIAEVAMWLVDHQMNMKVSEEFGQYFVRLPLQKAARIVHGNALQLDWNSLIKYNVLDIEVDSVNIFQASEPFEKYQTLNVKAREVNIYQNVEHDEEKSKFGKKVFDYILGNPPFIGKHLQNESQKEDLDLVFRNIQGAGVLDYVACWFLKAAQYIQNTQTKVAFVSTNSVSQGEQVAVLWGLLFTFYKIKIHFAHRTFSWKNEAKGNAAVHCVIVGFYCPESGLSALSPSGGARVGWEVKSIFDYEDIKGEPSERKVKNINPYLAEGSDMVVGKRTRPLEQVSPMMYGSKPTDGGFLLMDDEQKVEYIKREPLGKRFIRPFISAKEFLNNENRWCFWLVNADPGELKKLPLLYERIENVKKMRLESTKVPTQKLAQIPMLFAEIRQPTTEYIVVPLHSSENRKYIPVGFFEPESIVSNSCSCIPYASLYLFGVITSQMHMAWVKTVCGRLESRFRYSSDIVYNNYPFPRNVDIFKRKAVEVGAQSVLDARKKYPMSSLSDLYDPITMPIELIKAHEALDKAVDQSYRSQAFPSDLIRIEFLFGLYELYTEPLFKASHLKKTKKQNG